MPVINKLKKRRQDEAGAVAIAYALMVVMLLSIAALGTDLGNAISRHTSTQSQADFAAYDAGQLLTTSARAGMTPSAAILQQVADTLNANQPQNDGAACASTNPPTCVTTSMLTDGNLANSEVQYTSLGLQVISPRARVQFGFANIFGIDDTAVDSAATVNVFSPGKRVLPMFAVSGCDEGRETLTDPAGGPAVGTPNLLPADSGGGTKLTMVKVIDPSGNEVESVPVGGVGYKVWVYATDWNTVKQLGFFFPDVTSTNLNEPKQSPSTGAALPATFNDPGLAIQVPVPTNVASTEGVWYVKGLSGSANKWSPNATAPSFRVGVSLLECSAGSTSGNFGTLKLPRTGTPTSNDIPLNIALGLKDPLNLVVHDYARVNTTDGLCHAPDHFAVESPGTGPSPINPDTNCVDTDTGVTSGVATEGLVTSSAGGLLANKPTHAGCAPDGSSNSRILDMSPTDYSINDDVLSCFLKPGLPRNATMAAIAQSDYAGGPVFTSDLLLSPRFAYVPILKVQPTSGGSNRYSIIDFRAAFITDETETSAATADNGIHMHSGKIETLKVFFFGIDALPRDGSIPVIDYLGVGRPIVHLVD